LAKAFFFNFTLWPTAQGRRPPGQKQLTKKRLNFPHLILDFFLHSMAYARWWLGL